jgi:class 3 adenylate cyclase
VIGSSRLAYDYWGDTMNVASRLQAVAPPGGVAVSEAAWYEIRHLHHAAPQRAVLKGIGETDVFVVTFAAEGPDNPGGEVRPA